MYMMIFIQIVAETVGMDIIQAIQAIGGDCPEGMHTFNIHSDSTVYCKCITA